MQHPAYSEEQLDTALEDLTDMSRFRDAEAMVTRAAPKLQQILNAALEAGGWFGESHQAQTLKVATLPDSDERISALRTLLAEETRIGMMVGVTVGWALAERLAESEKADSPDSKGDS